jgi:uncharacterized membrane protein (TIGR02234 family)
VNGRRLKLTSILAGLAFAGLVLAAWSQTWYVVVLTGDSAGHPPLDVAGDVSAPALAALALAALAGFGALAISGPVFRVVLAVLEAVLGGCIVLSSALAISSPIPTVEPAVTAATSVAGTEGVAALIGSIAPTPWPAAALVGGGLLVLLALGILVTGRAWPRAGRKYEPVRFEEAEDGSSGAGTDAVSAWDALSTGTDPTSR